MFTHVHTYTTSDTLLQTKLKSGSFFLLRPQPAYSVKVTNSHKPTHASPPQHRHTLLMNPLIHFLRLSLYRPEDVETFFNIYKNGNTKNYFSQHFFFQQPEKASNNHQHPKNMKVSMEAGSYKSDKINPSASGWQLFLPLPKIKS